MALQQTWDLESIFPGGSSSPQLKTFVETLEKDIQQLERDAKALNIPKMIQGTSHLEDFLGQFQSAFARIREVSAFISCLTAQNVNDKKAVQWAGRITLLSANLQAVKNQFDNILWGMSDELWTAWTASEQVSDLDFVLNESRNLAQEKMSPELESLALSLGVDGYHGWGKMYDTIVKNIQIPYEEEGKTTLLSAGQAFNKLQDPRREVRQAMFEKWEQAWSDSADYCADTLNHLSGYRLKLYENRGWDDVLKEPLAIGRMSRQTLDTMWAVIQDTKPVLVEYLNRKAKLLGLDGLAWTDVDAPLSTSAAKISYEDAAANIVDQFRKFSPRMADFAQMAFDKGWIEAEDRPGKRPGAFCTSFPDSDQTRVFMTFGGTASNVSTLAHELGHAYHQHVMRGIPVLNQKYAMNVAETASTFAEMIVFDAMVKGASSEDEKLALLEEKIQNSVAFFMNIHARFLFETRFYDRRKKGLLSSEDISELMVEAQKEAYCDTLTSYHPHFWASSCIFISLAHHFITFLILLGICSVQVCMFVPWKKDLLLRISTMPYFGIPASCQSKIWRGNI